MLKDYIGSAEEVIKYIEFAKSIGVTDVYFRDLFHLKNRNLSTRFADLKKLEYTDQQRIDFNGLVEDVGKNPEFLLKQEMSRHKEQGKTFVFNYKGLRVSFGSLEVGTENPEDYTYFAFMPDGKVYKNMNGPESIGKI